MEWLQVLLSLSLVCLSETLQALVFQQSSAPPCTFVQVHVHLRMLARTDRAMTISAGNKYCTRKNSLTEIDNSLH